MRDVMPAPQGWHCRHGQHQPPAGRELGLERGERSLVVWNMLEHVEQHDQVVISVLQRHVGQIAALDRHARAAGSESARMIVRLDRIDRPELLQHGDVGSCAAADLQDPQRLLFGPPTLDQRGEDLAAADEPPMVSVDLGHPVIDVAFHQASSSPASPIFSRTM